MALKNPRGQFLSQPFLDVFVELWRMLGYIPEYLTLSAAEELWHLNL